MGITWTCLGCGEVRYLDRAGVAMPPSYAEAPVFEWRKDNVSEWRWETVCTTVRVYRRERTAPSHQGSWALTPHDGCYVVRAYHRPINPINHNLRRTIDAVQILPHLPDGMLPGDFANFRQAVLSVLVYAWGEGPDSWGKQHKFEVL